MPNFAIDKNILDTHLDAVLRASGSALRHYSNEKTKEEMRAAMATAIQWGYLVGMKEAKNNG